MKTHCDLHLRDPGSAGELDRMLGLAHTMGYKIVGLTTSTRRGVDVARRIDLEPRRSGELLQQLGKVRMSNEVVAVRCLSKEVSRQAARDHRVDLLLFPRDPRVRKSVRFDTQAAELARDAGASLEVDAATILSEGFTVLAPLMKRELDVARRFDVPVVLTSGASSALGLREPRALTALMALLDTPEEDAELMITENPRRIVERSRGKLSPGFVEPGVRRVNGAC